MPVCAQLHLFIAVFEWYQVDFMSSGKSAVSLNLLSVFDFVTDVASDAL